MSMFSPGTMILLATAEEADRRGIARFEFGYDYNAYKVRLTICLLPGSRRCRNDSPNRGNGP